MKISIIVPVYNAEKYLRECINSIFVYMKKCEDIEMVIINDGSTDGSERILEEFSDCKNIRVIHNQNFGVSFSRNLGLSLAKGDYIMFVDADDTLDDNWYKTIRKGIEKGSDIVYFGNSLKECTKIDLLYRILGMNKSICIGGPYSKIFNKIFLDKNEISFLNGLVNGEDMLFNLEALSRTESISTISESYYNYRHYQGSSTRRFNEKIIDSDILFQYTLKKILSRYKIDSNQKERILTFCLVGAIVTMVDRISYAKGQKTIASFWKRLYEAPYSVIIDSRKNKLQLTNKQKFIIFLYRNELKEILFFLFRIKHFILSRRKRECLVKIT